MPADITNSAPHWLEAVIASGSALPGTGQASAAQAAVATTAATSTTPFGFTTAAQADALVALVNALRLALVNVGIIKGSA